VNEGAASAAGGSPLDESGLDQGLTGSSTPSQPGDDPFAAALAQAFDQRSPQGSLTWNFDVAFAMLDEEFGAGEPERLWDPSAGGAGVPPPSSGFRGVLERLVLHRLRRWVDDRAALVASETTSQAIREGLGRTGVAQSVEALRFLARRVELLEGAAANRRSPVRATEFLLPPSSMDPWVAPLVELARNASWQGDVLLGECGGGTLVEALRSSGIDARGVEPRGPLAWEAAQRGLPVRLGDIGHELAARGCADLGAVVLSGVVDRLEVAELVGLLSVAVKRLAAGGTLVVISTDPDQPAAGWSAVASDLLPGRPLHLETWRLLLHRWGFGVVDELAPDPSHEGRGGQYALWGRLDL
jgi:hypothetical protein